MEATGHDLTGASGRSRAAKLLRAFSRAAGVETLPSVSLIARENADPYQILFSTWISLRTKDEVTLEASRRLFRSAPTVTHLAALRHRAIEKAIYPAAFYRTKARDMRAAARRLVNDFGGVVPDSVETLLTFRGVGRKTATLVVSLGYGREAICVDTHVHRVCNRAGLVRTRTPGQTEKALMELLPRGRWIGLNELLVRFGQQVCRPVSPLCSGCPARRLCPRNGVNRSR